MSRQRQKTRIALIGAALSVMAKKGVEAATINDITEAADVGFGSFYNHFASKEEILAVVTDELLERIGGLIDATTSAIDEPWRKFATAIRLFIRIVISKPEWAQFIVRVSADPNYRKHGIFRRLFRDIDQISEAAGSHVVDPELARYSIGGAMLFMISALLEGELPKRGAAERIAAGCLRILGCKEAAIVKLIEGRLPKLPEISLED